MAVLRCPVLIGRDAEAAALRSALAAAQVGRGSVVGVVGPPGIGKSRLVREFTDHVDGRPFVGRCVGAGSPPALRPLTEAMLSGLRAVDLPTGPDLDPFRPALSRVLPFWPASSQPVEASPVVLAEGVLRLLCRAARPRPAVLVIEDLHWADPDTLAVVEYLADNVASASLLVVLTARGGPGPVHDLRRRLAERDVLHELLLAPLTDDQAQSMAAACLSGPPSPERIAVVRTAAEGLPLLVEELLAVSDTGVVPSTIAEATAAKMAALGGSARAVVRAAAVLGARFAWDLLAAVVDHDPASVLDDVRAAVAVDLITEVPGGFAFRHALTRDAVLAATLRTEQAFVARRAWEAAKLDDGAHDGEWYGTAAHFAVVAGEPRAAVGLLLSAARLDLASGALPTAESALRRAATLTDDAAELADVDELLAEILIAAERPAEAAEVTTTLLANLRDGDRVARAHLRLARAWAATARWTDAAREAEVARAASTGPGPEFDHVDALVAFGCEDFDRSERLARAVSAAAAPPPVVCAALELRGRIARRHDLAAAAELFDRALATAERHDLPVWRLRALHELSTVDMLGSLDTARVERAAEEAARSGAVGLLAYAHFHRAVIHCWRDELDASVVRLADCERLCRSLRLPLLAMALVMQALNAVKRRQPEQHLCAEAAAVAAADPHVHAAVAHVQATRLLLAEDRPGALAVLDPVVESYRDRLETTSGPPLALWTLLATLERGDDALRRAATLPGIRLARWTDGYVGYAEAVSLGRSGRAEAAVEAFRTAEHTMTHPVPMPHFRNLARRHVAEAALADSWGDPVRWLREDEACFRGDGHAVVASACRGLLRRSGAPVPRRTAGPEVPAVLSGFGVTGREMEVLLLVADGLGNREIAERLVLSTRTVEKHVERLLAKTGATQRIQLVARAARGDWAARR